MLQIVPSKTNEERLLLVSPELASVLAAIITRLRDRQRRHRPTAPRATTTTKAAPARRCRTCSNAAAAWRLEALSATTSEAARRTR